MTFKIEAKYGTKDNQGKTKGKREESTEQTLNKITEIMGPQTLQNQRSKQVKRHRNQQQLEHKNHHTQRKQELQKPGRQSEDQLPQGEVHNTMETK